MRVVHKALLLLALVSLDCAAGAWGQVGGAPARTRRLSQGELYVTPGTLSGLIGRPTTPLADAIRAALG